MNNFTYHPRVNAIRDVITPSLCLFSDDAVGLAARIAVAAGMAMNVVGQASAVARIADLAVGGPADGTTAICIAGPSSCGKGALVHALAAALGCSISVSHRLTIATDLVAIVAHNAADILVLDDIDRTPTEVRAALRQAVEAGTFGRRIVVAMAVDPVTDLPGFSPVIMRDLTPAERAEIVRRKIVAQARGLGIKARVVDPSHLLGVASIRDSIRRSLADVDGHLVDLYRAGRHAATITVADAGITVEAA